MSNCNSTGQKYKRYSNRIGDKIHLLTIVSESFFKIVNGNKRVRWVVAKCECGVQKEYRVVSLRNGTAKSCGCYSRALITRKVKKHGLSSHPLYVVFKSMTQRCYNPKNNNYINYGGRGIIICDEWRKNFSSFFNWCMANGYQEGLSIDRINNDGIYEPSNCRLTTVEVQSKNKRTTRFYEAFGTVKCMFDWGRDDRCKVSLMGLRQRLDSGKWDDRIEEAITTPIRHPSEYNKESRQAIQIVAFNEKKCMSEWIKDSRCLVKIDAFRDRFAKGWSPEEIMTTPPFGRKNIGLSDQPLNKVDQNL